MNPRAIEVHIEELVLHGFTRGDRYALGDAVQRELTRLFGERGVPVSLRSERATEEIGHVTYNAARNAQPAIVGRKVAGAVYQTFRR